MRPSEERQVIVIPETEEDDGYAWLIRLQALAELRALSGDDLAEPADGR